MKLLEVNHLKKYIRPVLAEESDGAAGCELDGAGEYVAVMGESGSGKTTPQYPGGAGQAHGRRSVANGQNIVRIPERTLVAFRREHLGFVFQDFNLLTVFRSKTHLPAVSSSGMKYEEMNRRSQ